MLIQPRFSLWVLLIALALTSTACRRHADKPIVGVWVVNIPGAPFPMHMFAFHRDGTVEQSNPDAGDARTSDSNLMGSWVREGEGFRAKMIEFNADRETHKLVSRAEISFRLKVSGDTMSGSAHAVIYDSSEHPVGAPIDVTLTGKRVTP